MQSTCVVQVYVVCSTDAWATAQKKGWYQVDVQKGGYIQCTSLQQPIQLTNVSAQVSADILECAVAEVARFKPLGAPKLNRVAKK